MLEHAQYQKSLSITTLNDRGKIIARVPRYEESFGRDVSKSELFVNLRKSKSGNYRSVSLVEKDLRIYSYRALEKYPLIVSVGMHSPLLVDTLKDDAPEVIGGLLTVLMILLFGGRFALNSFRNIETYALRQQHLNQQLDAAQSEIDVSSRRARMIADNMPALVAYLDSQQRYQFRNSFYQHVPQIDYERMIGQSIRDVFGAEGYAEVEQEVLRALKGETVIFERERLARDGKTVCLRYQYSPDIRDDGTVAGFYTLVTDVSDMKTIQNQLMALTRVDVLTGLPNRTALYERISEAVARAMRHNHIEESSEKVGCLFLDIDHFKIINDTHGHACGDEVLKEFGARIKSCVRQTDTAARLAGDEFVIVLEGLDQPDGAATVAGKIIEAMQLPYVTVAGALEVTASIGIAISARADDTAESLLWEADRALYQAKKNGRNSFALTTDELFVT